MGFPLMKLEYRRATNATPVGDGPRPIPFHAGHFHSLQSTPRHTQGQNGHDRPKDCVRTHTNHTIPYNANADADATQHETLAFVLGGDDRIATTPHRSDRTWLAISETGKNITHSQPITLWPSRFASPLHCRHGYGVARRGARAGAKAAASTPSPRWPGFPLPDGWTPPSSRRTDFPSSRRTDSPLFQMDG